MKSSKAKSDDLLEKALQPFEERLRAQEEFRRRLGVKQVDRPTYHRYITGPIERIDPERFFELFMGFFSFQALLGQDAEEVAFLSITL